MDGTEFKQWWAHHNRKFLNLGKWLQDRMGSQDRNQDAYVALMADWKDCLASCEYDDCLDASTELWEAAERYPDYGNHPQRIRAIAKRLQASREAPAPSKYADGQVTYGCLLCLDQGMVSGWSKKAMQAARDGTLDELFAPGLTALACTCRAGETTSNKLLPRYDPETRLMPTVLELPTWDQQKNELREFVAKSDAGHAEFAAFGDQQEWTG